MKYLFILIMLCSVWIYAGAIPQNFHGVWADKDSELVLTGKFALLFERDGEVITSALWEIIRKDDNDWLCFISSYSFDNTERSYTKLSSPVEGGTVLFSDYAAIEGEKLICKSGTRRKEMNLVEKITITEPYHFAYADGSNLGVCLQQWQSGSKIFGNEQEFTLQIGTNRHSYIYSESPHMIYCRAANIRHNNNGSLFAQTTRMMANSNEFTAYMFADNEAQLRREIVINDDLFIPDTCTFAEDGIYWSVVEYTPEVILLNGCGETYTFGRPGIEEELAEWFAYEPY